MEAKCPFYAICGASVVRDSWAKREYPYGDSRRDFIGSFCQTEEYLACSHYKIREEKQRDASAAA